MTSDIPSLDLLRLWQQGVGLALDLPITVVHSAFDSQVDLSQLCPETFTPPPTCLETLDLEEKVG